MYYTGKYKDCGDWYFSGECKPYSSLSDPSPLLQTGGAASVKRSGNYKIDDMLPPKYPDVISFHPEKNLTSNTFKDATNKLECTIPRKKLDKSGHLVWQEWDCEYVNN